VLAVRATSFAPKNIVERWHAAHPDWQYIAEAGAVRGFALINVPQDEAAHVTFQNVWFSTRPQDDVFADDPVDVRIGPSAFDSCIVTLDYVHGDAVFSCWSLGGRVLSTNGRLFTDGTAPSVVPPKIR
jgi:hypothetical protein